jgi:hypothetical protein
VSDSNRRRSRTFQLLVGVSMLLTTVSLQLMGSSAAYQCGVWTEMRE